MALNFKVFALCLIVLIFEVDPNTLASFVEANTCGVTLDLVHRDSSLSPSYDPSQSSYDRLNNALRRSFTRKSSFDQMILSSSSSKAQLQPNGGEYLVKVDIGTPQKSIMLIVDTGSDLTWTQCKPCSSCYKQKDPLFDPSQSSTYKSIKCGSQTCEKFEISICSNDPSCSYQVTYGDNSYSRGNLAIETLALGSLSSKAVFGCGHDDGGLFNEAQDGILGLGGGSVSLVTQLGKSINGKFSHCLVPSGTNSPGKINFGKDAVVSGPGVVTTPIYKDSSHDTFYYLSLQSISVGGKNINFENSKFRRADDSEGVGNIIIDCGTTLTFIPDDLYSGLESELRESVKGEIVDDPKGEFSLCYNSQGLEVPQVTFHFANDASVKLGQESTVIETSEGVACLGILPSIQGISLFGNRSQMNLLVGYDVENQQISFKPTDCTK